MQVGTDAVLLKACCRDARFLFESEEAVRERVKYSVIVWQMQVIKPL